MQTSEIVPIDSFVASAKIQLKLGDDNSVDIWFEKLANEGIRRLGCLSLIKKNVQIFDIFDNKIKLPKGLINILAVRLGDEGGCSTAIEVDMDFMKSCGCSSNKTFVIGNTFEVQNGILWFHKDVTDYTHATIAYTTYDLGTDSLMAAHEDYESAITYFICYHYALQNFEKYPKGIIDEYWGQWISQRRIIINSDFVKSARETKMQLREWLNALIVEKWSFNNMLDAL